MQNPGLVLVAEDDALIAQDLIATLGREEISAVSFASCSEAEHWVSTATPAAAVLDVALRDGPCRILAETLAARGIGIVVYSGFPPEKVEDWALHDRARYVGKPALYEDIIGAVRQALALTASLSAETRADRAPEGGGPSSRRP